MEEEVVVLMCPLAVYMAVISGHSKIDKAKILTSKCSLMKVKVIAECPMVGSLVGVWSVKVEFT